MKFIMVSAMSVPRNRQFGVILSHVSPVGTVAKAYFKWSWDHKALVLLRENDQWGFPEQSAFMILVLSLCLKWAWQWPYLNKRGLINTIYLYIFIHLFIFSLDEYSNKLFWLFVIIFYLLRTTHQWDFSVQSAFSLISILKKGLTVNMS